MTESRKLIEFDMPCDTVPMYFKSSYIEYKFQYYNANHIDRYLFVDGSQCLLTDVELYPKETHKFKNSPKRR